MQADERERNARTSAAKARLLTWADVPPPVPEADDGAEASATGAKEKPLRRSMSLERAAEKRAVSHNRQRAKRMHVRWAAELRVEEENSDDDAAASASASRSDDVTSSMNIEVDNGAAAAASKVEHERLRQRAFERWAHSRTRGGGGSGGGGSSTAATAAQKDPQRHDDAKR